MNGSRQLYIAKSWPGQCVWLDFFNDKARDYWRSLFQYNVFNGTTPIYGFWNDMNEPSVFDDTLGTLPLNAVHTLKKEKTILHRDVHNAYGAMMHRESYRGALERDGYVYRQFVLTRSYFIGSQKWGAFWTGDNWAVDT